MVKVVNPYISAYNFFTYIMAIITKLHKKIEIVEWTIEC
jgi:hypothetical protein